MITISSIIFYVFIIFLIVLVFEKDSLMKFMFQAIAIVILISNFRYYMNGDKSRIIFVLIILLYFFIDFLYRIIKYRGIIFIKERKKVYEKKSTESTNNKQQNNGIDNKNISQTKNNKIENKVNKVKINNEIKVPEKPIKSHKLGLIRSKKQLNFLAIDFETANNNRDSACALALIEVKRGEIINKTSLMIQPTSSFFEFTYIHGIKWSDVKDSPTFLEHWPIIYELIVNNSILVGHNVSFDKSVLNACCSYYGLELPQKSYLCTVKLAKEVWNIRPTKLPNVCDFLGIELKHHDPTSDAVASAKIVIQAFNKQGHVKVYENQYSESTNNKQKNNGIDNKNISQTKNKKIENKVNKVKIYNEIKVPEKPLKSHKLGLIRSKKQLNFLAIDFETANNNRDSACALALIEVKRGEIINKTSLLIQPTSSFFKFTYIHDIKWSDVKDSPTFLEHWPIIYELIVNNSILVGHNVSFDKSVLNACCSYYGLELPQKSYLCTVKLAKEVWNIRPTKLPNVCDFLGIELKHHDPTSDAVASAKIVIQAFNEQGYIEV
jgi:DNA polymerase-3 subunit epsilon